jgi:hypothetical protein
MNELQLFLDSEAGLALKAVLIVAFLDFITGVFAAFRDRTFAFDAIAAFLRKHIAGRVAPIATLLVVGYFGGSAGQLFLAGAIAAGAAYAAESAASIWGNVNPPKPSAEVEATNPAEAVNPVPED